MNKPVSKSAGEGKQIAKSLHTVTVLIQVARHLIRSHAVCNSDAAERDRGAVAKAMELLELAGRPDPYGLEAKALRLLNASEPR